MCYTIEINLTREQLEKRFRANLDKHLPYRKQNRVSAFSLPECPVICSNDPAEIKLMQWGLVPAWSRDEEFAKEIRMKTFNARSETLDQKPSYRHLIKRNRCLVLTNGFYEWQTREKGKQPYYISLKEEEAFALAGLHDKWTNRDTGEILDTFTVITTRANPMMEKIHNTKKRMPVILDRIGERDWIDPELDQREAMSILKPYDEMGMIAEEVDLDLFRKNPNPDQTSLF